MSARDYFAVVGRRRRRSSVISLFRHRDGPVKKIKFSPFFKNKQYFQNSRLLCKMSAHDFPLSSQGRPCEKNQIFDVFQKQVVESFFRRRRGSSVISLFRQRYGPVKKNQIFTVFQKQPIFPKFKIFRQNECTRFFSASWVVAVVARPSFPSFVTGTDL